MSDNNATNIPGMTPSYPAGTDDIQEGNDQLQMLKRVLQYHFPTLTGIITASHSEINQLDGWDDLGESFRDANGNLYNVSQMFVVQAQQLARTKNYFYCQGNVKMLFMESTPPVGWLPHDSHQRRMICINNTTPALLADSAERAEPTDAGWEVAWDGLEIALP